MFFKRTALIVLGATIGLSAAIPAQAYELYYWANGDVHWVCKDGTVGILDDGSEPDEATVIAACADHGGLGTSWTMAAQADKTVTISPDRKPSASSAKGAAVVSIKR